MSPETKPDTSAEGLRKLADELEHCIAWRLGSDERCEIAVSIAMHTLRALADAAGQAAPVPPTVEVGPMQRGDGSVVWPDDDLVEDAEADRRALYGDAAIPPPVELETTERERELLAMWSNRPDHSEWFPEKEVACLLRDFDREHARANAEHERAEGLAKEVERLKDTCEKLSDKALDVFREKQAAEAKLALYEAPLADGEIAGVLEQLEALKEVHEEDKKFVRAALVHNAVTLLRRLSTAKAEREGWKKRELPPADLPPPETLVRYPDGSMAAMMFHFAAEGHRFDEIADQAGYETRFVSAESDLGEDSALWREYENGGNIFDRWTPAPPDGWTLGGTFDTEDGPCACFIRRAALAPASEERS